MSFLYCHICLGAVKCNENIKPRDTLEDLYFTCVALKYMAEWMSHALLYVYLSHFYARSIRHPRTVATLGVAVKYASPTTSLLLGYFSTLPNSSAHGPLRHAACQPIVTTSFTHGPTPKIIAQLLTSRMTCGCWLTGMPIL